MPLQFDITLTVHGKEHSGKTSLIAVLEKYLNDNGYNVTVARTDRQLEEKQEHIDDSIARAKKSSILINESIL